MSRAQALVVAALVAAGAGVFLLGRRGAGETANPQGDPDMGRHRGIPYQPRPGAGTGAPLRAPSAQDPHPERDYEGYPYGRTQPALYAQGYPKGRGMQLGGDATSPLNYGEAPRRIPKLWKDGTRYWDGVMQHGSTQQNYRVFLFHLRPSMPTRGYRSVSGVLYNGGPTASRARIPAIFVPSAVA